MSQQTDFINRIVPDAQKAMNKYRVLASLSIAQAILETGYGDSVPGNNLFGIKANGWTGKTVTTKTTEENESGDKITITATFRAYPSWAASIDDHGAFIAGNERYANILGVADYKTVCNRLQADGYATAVDYASNLISLIEQYRLYQYDRLPSITTIDIVMTDGESGNVTVSGWALNMAGLAHVDIYYDVAHGAASTKAFTDRADVNKAVNSAGWYPDGERCGFNVIVPAGKIPLSKHSIDVVAVGKDGTVMWSHKANVTVTAPIPAPMGCIDYPAEGANINAEFKLSGWGVAGAGVERVDISFDSIHGIGSVSAFYERADVNKAINPHGYYIDALHSGFEYTIPASLLGKGKHTLDVAVISKDGRAANVSRVVNII
jgi:hypothetical protein